ncbi:MAG TPA: medium chain dehydrogenase/reductase family protein [Thermoleophilaceae bacterium]|jgi:NADPH:quinone reductase-like Zn-dependent oxidoreductase
MRALVITEHGPPDVLAVQERPDPVPGPGEVRVAVRAAGVNFADLVARLGFYRPAPKPPCVVGYEFAGEVESTGEGVDRVAVGDRVLGSCRFGGYAELVSVPEANLIPLPDDWSYETGAALPVNYATAYAGVLRFGTLQAGERVLVHAAAGGVGIAATQIAKLAGAEVYGTASASKHEAIRRFGVDHPIDYRAGDVAAAVRRIAGAKEPLDLVLDAVGGRSFRKSYSLLRPGGRLVCLGASAATESERRDLPRAARTLLQTPWFNALKLFEDSRAAIGLNMLRIWDSRGSLAEFIDPLTEWTRTGAIEPVIAEAFPLERGADAHRFIHERRNVGKVVLVP